MRPHPRGARTSPCGSRVYPFIFRRGANVERRSPCSRLRVVGGGFSTRLACLLIHHAVRVGFSADDVDPIDPEEAGSGSADPKMTDKASQESRRDDRSEAVLLHSSALRESAAALEASPGDARRLDEIVGAGRGLVAALRHHDLELLSDGGDALEKMAILGRSLGRTDPAAATEVFGGLIGAVGVLEQSLDALLAGATADRLEAYGEALLDSFPPRWRAHIDPREAGLDGDAGENDVVAPVAPGGAGGALAPEVDPTELAFLSETLEALARCEERCLEPEPDARQAIASDLQALEEPLAAVGLTRAAAFLREARALLDAAPDDAGARSAPADFVLATIDAVRRQAAEACGLARFTAAAQDLAGAAEHLRGTGEPVPAPDDAGEPLGRLLRRLRPPLRAAARRAGCDAEIEIVATPLRLEPRLAGRLLEALSCLVTSGFAGAGAVCRPGSLRFFRLRVEPWESGPLVLVVDDDEAGAQTAADGLDDGDPAEGAAAKPEALHWIDATRPTSAADGERLVYRWGSLNVVEAVVPDGSIEAAA